MHDSDVLETRLPYVAARFVGWGILAAIIYGLSIGPAYWLIPGRSPVADRLTVKFYAPVYRISAAAKMDDVVAPYCIWWAELPGGTVERVLR